MWPSYIALLKASSKTILYQYVSSSVWTVWRRFTSAMSTSEDEDAERDDGRPQTLRVPFGALDDVACLQDVLCHLESLLALAPRLLGVEVDAECRREHRRREVLRVVAGLLRGLAVAVVLREVAVLSGIARTREPDRRRDEPVRLVRVLARHHAVNDLSRHDVLAAFLAADLAAARREDRADGDEVRLLDVGVA